MAQIPTSIINYKPEVRAVSDSGVYSTEDKTYMKNGVTTFLIGASGNEFGVPQIYLDTNFTTPTDVFKSTFLHSITLSVVGSNNNGTATQVSVVKIVNGRESSSESFYIYPSSTAGSTIEFSYPVTPAEIRAGVKYILRPFDNNTTNGVFVDINMSAKVLYWKILSTSCSTNPDERFSKIAVYEDGYGFQNSDILEENSIDCGYKPQGYLISEACGTTGANRYSKIGVFSTGKYDKDGNFSTYQQVTRPNVEECGYIPKGTKLSEFCGTDKNRRYARVGVFSTGLFSAETGEFSTYEEVIEKDAVSCGYQPRGTLLRTACSTGSDSHRLHELIGFYSEGTYDSEGVFNTYEQVIDPRSISCGYEPTGNVTFTSNDLEAVFEVAGKGTFTPNQTVNNWTLGAYTYTAKAQGRQAQAGSFTVTPAGVIVSATFPGAESPCFFQFVGSPDFATVYDLVNGEKVFLGLTGSGAPMQVEEGQYVLSIEKEGYRAQTRAVTAVLGETVEVSYSLPALPVSKTDEVYYQAFLTDPRNYKVIDRVTLKDAFGFTYTEKYREQSTFSFSVPFSIGEFEDIIASENGELGVLLYVNGVPKIQGLITNKTLSGEGFTAVSCVEVLGGLVDAWNGRLELDNIDFEYIPSDSGISEDTDIETLYEYWNYGFGKSNFFYADSMYVTSRLAEDSNGVYAAQGSQNVIKLRPFKARKFSSYTAHAKGIGKPFSIFTFNEAGAAELSFDGLRFNLTNKGELVGSSEMIEKYTIAGGQQDIYESLANAEVYYTFRYEEISSTKAKVSVEIRVLYLAVDKLYTIESKTININENQTVEPSFSISNGSGIAKFYVEAKEKVTLLDWLNKVGEGQEGYHSVKVRFMQGLGSGASGTALRLSYEDPERWTVVRDILDLAGAVTTEYVGVLGGIPTYLVHDTEKLPRVRKFYNSGDIFNVSYAQDLANVFNVLTVRASDNVKGMTQQTNNTIVVTIYPSPERPNRLGRLEPHIQGVEGIRDIQTLTKYALAVYSEHSQPSEPVDFESFTDNSWLEILPGQSVSIYGLPDGRVLTNKISSMSFNEQSGTTRIELGEIIGVSEAIQRKLRANAF